MTASITTPPPMLDGARVLVYAILDDYVVRTGHLTLYVDGKLLGPVPRLAICQDSDSNDVLLLFCDSKWHSLGVVSCSSLKEAQQRAEAEYQGVSAKWVHMNISAEKAAQHGERQWKGQHCSFCGKRPDQIEKMFQSYGARICNECVKAFYLDLT